MVNASPPKKSAVKLASVSEVAEIDNIEENTSDVVNAQINGGLNGVKNEKPMTSDKPASNDKPASINKQTIETTVVTADINVSYSKSSEHCDKNDNRMAEDVDEENEAELDFNDIDDNGEANDSRAPLLESDTSKT